MSEAQLRWQCRRGMRELDLLLADFLANDYAGAGNEQKAAFRALLSLSDPELIGYLLGGQNPEEEGIAGIVRHIRNKARS